MNGQVQVNKKHQKYGGDIFEKCLDICRISPSSVLIKKDVFDEIGLFDESLRVCEDYDMWLRYTSRFPVLFLDRQLIIKYGGHSDQLSRVLNFFRRGEMPDKYVILRLKEGQERFRVMAVSGVKGTPPRVVDDKVYENLNEAYHAVFLLRVNDLLES